MKRQWKNEKHAESRENSALPNEGALKHSARKSLPSFPI